MPLFETEAIVLKSYNLAEADRIVVFFTREHGIVRGVAKGARRLNSRFGSTLEPFSTVKLEYFQKEDRELVSIQNIDLLSSRFEAASDPSFFQTFSYIVDLLTLVEPPHDPNERLYRMVKACVESATTSGEDLPALRLYFELWLLRLGGYLPEWDVCSICKRGLTTDEDANVSADFHLLCTNCRKTRGNQVMTGRHREVFFTAQRLSPAAFGEFAADKTPIVSDVSDVLRRIISSVTGRELASEKSFTVNFSQ